MAVISPFLCCVVSKWMINSWMDGRLPGVKAIGIIRGESGTKREQPITLHEVVAFCKINYQYD